MNMSMALLAQVIALVAALILPGFAFAETVTVRIAKQFGISYLPLAVMQADELLEAEAKKQGLDVKTEWVRFTGGTPINEALIAGNLEFASGGVGPFLLIWDKTRKNFGVKGVGALNAMPLFLNTTNPNIKTLKDFTDKDRIALPGVRTSIQAITLQMAAEKELGKGQEFKLDPLTVSMGHPDGMAAMLGGKTEIDAHFTSAPIMYLELKDPRVHRVLSSYDVLGGPHTFNVIWTTSKFQKENPKLISAFVAALEAAIKKIHNDPKGAAASWLKVEETKMSVDEAAAMIQLPENEWTITPKKIMIYAEFMKRVGLLKELPSDWKETFFDEVHSLPGS
jgi:NitT/TauT family transport system substrate-binding protein